MIRERALKVVLLLEGLLFLAAIYPISMNIWNQALDQGVMMLSIYFAMGIFLLVAVRSPASHRSLILFAGWTNVAHALVMAVMTVRFANERTFVAEPPRDEPTRRLGAYFTTFLKSGDCKRAENWLSELE